jgi:hypothetical protein
MHENKCAQLIAAEGNSCYWLSSEDPFLTWKKNSTIFMKLKKVVTFAHMLFWTTFLFGICNSVNVQATILSQAFLIPLLLQ